MSDLTLDVKMVLVKGRLEQWKRSYFSSTTDAKVAKAVGDEGLLKNATSAMKKCLTGIAFLEAMLEDMEGMAAKKKEEEVDVSIEG